MSIKKIKKSFVIDASIAKSSGLEKCRAFLNTIYDKNYYQVVSKEILEEWKKHESKFTRAWRKNMYSRKLVKSIEITEIENIEEKITKFANPQNALNAMLKDLLLIKASLTTDSVIASLDEKSRRPFSTTSLDVKELKNITWINPSIEEENVIEWMKNGAKIESDRFLCNYKVIK